MGDDLLWNQSLLGHAFPVPQHGLGDFTILEAAQLGARTPKLPKLGRLVGEHNRDELVNEPISKQFIEPSCVHFMSPALTLL